jgi:hypothetical protein
MKDYQVFQGKDRKHGYSYQAAVFPNGQYVVNKVPCVLFTIAPLPAMTDCFCVLQA